MLRPTGEAQNRLTHVLFPETILAIPQAGASLREHTERTFPQARIMAHLEKNDLYVRVSADLLTEDRLTERRSLVLTMDDVFFNSDIWDYFSDEDRSRLESVGFEPGLSREQWAESIRNCNLASQDSYETPEGIINVRELPLGINHRGLVGTPSSFHKMPGFTLHALHENDFTEDNLFYEIGSAHIHPRTEFGRIAEAVANRVGDRKAQMTVSPPDVRQIRGSQAANNELLSKFSGIKKDTGETFVSIVGVDTDGKVTDLRHHDFGLVDNPDEAFEINDRAMETLRSNSPDIGVLAEHYEFFSDPAIASDELGQDIGEHVGDPSYRYQE